MRFLYVLVLIFVFGFGNAQVGISTANPNAVLDVRSSNQATPTNEDGILVPKIDEFPVTNPTALQDGMLIFATGLGTPAKGFYYWNNTTTNWVALSGATINAENGITETTGTIRLGGTLNQNTTINNGNWNSAFNLNGSGDFLIQDNGNNKFQVLDNGSTRFGGDVEWRDNSTAGTILANLFDDGNDGRLTIRENGGVSIDLDANSQAVFNEQGLDRNFRIESDANANMFFLDAGTNRIGVGLANPIEELHVVGGSRITEGLSVGVTNFGVHSINTARTTGSSVVLGNTGFNNVESGRLTFEENSNNYLTTTSDYCGFQIYHNGSTDTLSFGSDCGTNINILTLERAGDVGIATNNPTAELSVNGTANKTGGGNWAVFSDRRLKKDITKYNEGLDLILKVKPVNFSYNSTYVKLFGGNDDTTSKIYQGVIAQELQKIAPDMVRVVNTTLNAANDADGGTPNPNGGEFLEIDPSKFTYALINSVQQQQQQIEKQQKEIEELKMMVQQLLNKNN